MKANKAEQQALITLLNRIYGEIRVIEVEWSVRVDEKDLRPRIEYFHDAIRALSSGAERTGRLDVEFLAYDIGMLRHIQANPLKKGKTAKSASLSPSTAVALPSSLSGTDEKSVRQQLSELYKNYAVLFAALLADTAERNYQSRVDERNTEVEDLATLEQAIKAAAKKQGAAVDIEALVEQHIEDPDLMNKILFHVHNNKQKKLMAQEALRKLKEMMDASDKEIKTVEQAHFTYVTSQLAVYEMARDVVKKMAVQGMNIVGNFVENAVREATRGGRGM